MSVFSPIQIPYIIPTQTISNFSGMIDNDQKETVIMVQNVFFSKKMGFFDALKAEQVLNPGRPMRVFERYSAVC